MLRLLFVFLSLGIQQISFAQISEFQAEYNSALSLVKQKNYTAAWTTLEPAVDNTSSGDILYLAGLIQQKQGNTNQATSYYKKTIDAQPDHTSALMNLGVILYNQEEFAAAAETFDQLSKHKQSKKVLEFKGRSYLKANKNEIALRTFNSLSAVYPTEGKWEYYKAKSYFALGKNKEGKAAIQAARKKGYSLSKQEELELQSTNTKQISVASIFNEGLEAQKNGDYKTAESKYKEAAEIEPKNVQIQYSLGVLYLNKNQFRKAVKQFERALELDPSNGNAYLGLGNAYKQLGDEAKAAAAYRVAAEYNGSNDGGDYALAANSAFHAGAYPEAVRLYKLAISIDPTIPEYHFNLGAAYSQMKEHASAIQAYEAAIDLRSDYTDAYYNLAVSFSDAKEYQEVKRLGEKLIALDPDDGYGYLIMAVYYNRINRSDLETKYMKQAKKRNRDIRANY